MATTTSWNPTAHADYDRLTGKAVFSRDGEPVGTITAVLHPADPMPAARGKHYFLLDPDRRRGLFGSLDEVYLPETTVELAGTESVGLNLTTDQLKRLDWTTTPTGLNRYRRA